jgi:uncharacterized protein YecE (DUF72 family)
MEDRRTMGSLKHYNIAAVMTDSPAKENLEFLSEVTVTTSDHSFIRFHGRNTKGHYWYDYLYSKEELKPWIEKVEEVKRQTKVLRAYFNNHYGGAAVINALQFKEMLGNRLSENESNNWSVSGVSVQQTINLTNLDLFSKPKTSSYILVFKQNLIHESLYYLHPIL